MAAVDSFHLLYQEIARSCHHQVEILTVVGACYVSWKGLCLLCDCYNVLRSHINPLLLHRTSLANKYGEWAVVTGATDGIGKAYAEELASRGMNIILISRNREKLQRVSEAIAAKYGVQTSFIEADFSKGREVFPAIRDGLKHVDVGILVNNAGVLYDYPERVTEVPEDKVWEIINVNIAAATMMVHIVVPGMVQRKKGAIVNVACGTCYKSNPQLTIYCASKVYLDRLSRDLHLELSPKGIFVQTLMPLCIATKSMTSCRKLHRFPILAPTPETYARHAVQTLGVSSRTAGYWAHSFQLVVAQWIPRWMCWSLGRFLYSAYP
ncbi:inactive hydroxysteroid dehydrogenase-like protein 1 [Spea bombifrons]|uniref:inactive hydroxysteroid dehydrogenase-like protein 1 n=1 Tax=Spea bombifrons TaxID=233779 RepID=UPI00234BDDDF|nr:inactive hydroxysteroid dehydrogenase-like protein 1 [Spea bombifrons]XP_053304873.1 inactive hydroxysteroid dehydrogenase-like protein 1 [Spea bombifrons]